MWTCLYVLAINFLVYKSLAHPQSVEHVHDRRDIDDTYDGYRCGRRVFTRKFLEEESRHAANTFGLYTLVPEFDFDPQTYTGRLKFGTSAANPIIWQLLQDEHVPRQPTTNYFVVLDIMNGGGVRIAGVLRRRIDHELNELKCIRENDLSEVSGHEFATGYRCPLDIYDFNMIENAMGLSLEDEETGVNFLRLTVTQFLYPTIRKPLFDDSEELKLRSITPIGKFHNTAAGAIITDKYFHFVGMVYKIKSVYTRCKLTVSDQIQIKFIGPALIQKPEIISPGIVDVFQCDRRMFLSNEIINIAGDALESFRKKKSYTTIAYPALHTQSDVSQRLYRWPVQTIFQKKVYDIPITVPNKRFFVLIDEFSNVYNVVEMVQQNKYIGCQRRLVERDYFYQSLLGGNPVQIQRKISRGP